MTYVKNDARILIVVPAYNEEDNIISTVNDLRENNSIGYDLIVVNDGSTDGTYNVCRKNGIPVLDLPINLGIGGGVQAGYKYARRFGYQIVLQFDGDGQHDAKSIALLVEKLIESQCDMVIGSRFVEKIDGNFQSTALRRIGIKWLSFVIKIATGQEITDPTSGFRAINAKALDVFCDSYPTDYPEPESVVKVLKHGFKVEELGVVMHGRKNGRSSIRALSSVYYMVKVTIAILLQGLTVRVER